MNKETLAHEVAYILELPFQTRRRVGKATEIVRAIFQVMTKALQSGQSIKVDGFGIFSIRERAPTRSQVAYFYGHKHLKPYRTIITLPTKKYVIFKPTKPLQRLLNEDPNGIT